MPIYDYRCSVCGHVEEVFQRAHAPAPEFCEKCHRQNTLARVIGDHGGKPRQRSLENRVNTSLTRAIPFIVDGKERGTHLTQRVLARDHYVINVDVDARLPELLAEPYGRPSGYTPRGIKQECAHRHLRVWSTGRGFAHALLSKCAALATAQHEIRMISVANTGYASQLTVSFGWPPQRCFEIASELTRRIDEIVDAGLVFPDVQTATSRLDDEPSPEMFTALMQDVTSGVSWLSGHTARVDRAIESRVTLHEGGVDYAGLLRTAMHDDRADVIDISLEGDLPVRYGPPLVLTPQRGLMARLRSLIEVRINDIEIDRAFVMRGDAAHAPAVLAARYPLLELAAHRATIEIADARLAILLPPASRKPLELTRIIDDALGTWRHAVICRAGAS